MIFNYKKSSTLLLYSGILLLIRIPTVGNLRFTKIFSCNIRIRSRET